MTDAEVGIKMKHYYRNIYSGQYRLKLESLDNTIYPPWLKGKWFEERIIQKKKSFWHMMGKEREVK